jgi:hypothetical protein
MIGIGHKRKLREFAGRWLKVAAHLDGKYAEAVKDVVRDLNQEFRLTPTRRPVRRKRAKK